MEVPISLLQYRSGEDTLDIVLPDQMKRSSNPYPTDAEIRAQWEANEAKGLGQKSWEFAKEVPSGLWNYFNETWLPALTNESLVGGLFHDTSDAIDAIKASAELGTRDIYRMGSSAIDWLSEPDDMPREERFQRHLRRTKKNLDYALKVRPIFASQAVGGKYEEDINALADILDPTIALGGGAGLYSKTLNQTVRQSLKVGLGKTSQYGFKMLQGTGWLTEKTAQIPLKGAQMVGEKGGFAWRGVQGISAYAMASGSGGGLASVGAGLLAMETIGKIAKVTGRNVSELGRIFAQPSSHARFLFRVTQDASVSPAMRSLASRLYRMGGTKVYDILFDALVAGIGAGALQSALQFASGADHQQAGQAFGAGILLGSPMGALGGARGSGKSTSAFDSAGNLSARSEQGIKDYLARKNDIQAREAMKELRKVSPHSAVLLSTLDEASGTAGVKMNIVSQEEMAEIQFRATGVRPAPKDTPAGGYDQTTRTITLNKGQLVQGIREASHTVAHEIGHDFIVQNLGQNPMTRRIILENYHDPDGKEFFFYGEDGAEVGSIHLNEDAVSFAEEYADRIRESDPVQADQILRDAGLLGDELGAEHFALLFNENPNAFALFEFPFRTALFNGARKVLSKFGIVDGTTGMDLASNAILEASAGNKALKNLHKSFIKERHDGVLKRAEDMETSGRISLKKGQNDAERFVELMGGMGVDMGQVGAFVIQDMKAWERLQQELGKALADPDNKFAGIGRDWEGQNLSREFIDLFIEGAVDKESARRVIEAFQMVIDERNWVTFGYRSGNRRGWNGYNPFYMRNVSLYGWQVSPKKPRRDRKTGKMIYPNLKVMGFNRDVVLHNVDVMVKAGLIKDPKKFLDKLSEHAKAVFTKRGQEGRINPQGMGENELFAMAFGTHALQADKVVNPKHSKFFNDPKNGLKKAMVSYDLSAINGMATGGGDGFVFDYRHIRDNYMPQNLPSKKAVNKYMPPDYQSELDLSPDPVDPYDPVALNPYDTDTKKPTFWQLYKIDKNDKDVYKKVAYVLANKGDRHADGQVAEWYAKELGLNLVKLKRAMSRQQDRWDRGLDNYMPPAIRPPETQEFKKWFGDSVIKDEQGNAKVVYHGVSGEDFSTFDQFRLNSSVIDSAIGYHFAENPILTDAFTIKNRYGQFDPQSGAHVKPVFLSMKKPLDLRGQEGFDQNIIAKAVAVGLADSAPDALWKFYEETGNSKADLLKRYGSLEGVIHNYGVRAVADPKTIRRLTDKFKEVTEYDGIIYDNTSPRETDGVTGSKESYIVFKPEQIKSALGNRGTFDPNSPDIRYMPPAPDTPEFRKWFKKSQVVNKDGTPKVMFHGSKRAFSEFKPKQSKRMGNELLFFAEDPEFAQKYAEGIGGHRVPNPELVAQGNRIKEKEMGWDEFMVQKYGSMEAYRAEEKRLKDNPDEYQFQDLDDYREYQAELFKPFRGQSDMEYRGDVRLYPVFISAQKLLDPRKDFKVVMDYYQSQEYRLGHVLGENKGGWDVFNRKKNSEGLTEAESLERHVKNGNYLVMEDGGLIEYLKEKGYDGVRISENTIDPEYGTIAIWDNTKVKSATGNRGTFDPNNPDIRYMPSNIDKRAKEAGYSRKFYHGAPMESIDSIKEKGMDRLKSLGGYWGRGFYMSPDISVARDIYGEFQMEEGEAGGFLTAYLKDDANIVDFTILDGTDARNDKLKQLYNSLVNPPSGTPRKRGSHLSDKDHDLFMKRNGIDGIIDNSIGGLGGLVVYNTDVLKFDFSNFDSTNPDPRYMPNNREEPFPKYFKDGWVLPNGNFVSATYYGHDTAVKGWARENPEHPTAKKIMSKWKKGQEQAWLRQYAIDEGWVRLVGAGKEILIEGRMNGTQKDLIFEQAILQSKKLRTDDSMYTRTNLPERDSEVLYEPPEMRTERERLEAWVSEFKDRYEKKTRYMPAEDPDGIIYRLGQMLWKLDPELDIQPPVSLTLDEQVEYMRALVKLEKQKRMLGIAGKVNKRNPKGGAFGNQPIPWMEQKIRKSIEELEQTVQEYRNTSESRDQFLQEKFRDEGNRNMPPAQEYTSPILDGALSKNKKFQETRFSDEGSNIKIGVAELEALIKKTQGAREEASDSNLFKFVEELKRDGVKSVNLDHVQTLVRAGHVNTELTHQVLRESDENTLYDVMRQGNRGVPQANPIKDIPHYGEQDMFAEEYEEHKFSIPPHSTYYRESLREDFHRGHWNDDPNVLFHYRKTTRTYPDGREVYFIEEIQSDIHQKGSKKGYLSREEAEARTADANRYLQKRSDKEQVHNDTTWELFRHAFRWLISYPNQQKYAWIERLVESEGGFELRGEEKLLEMFDTYFSPDPEGVQDEGMWGVYHPSADKVEFDSLQSLLVGWLRQKTELINDPNWKFDSWNAPDTLAMNEFVGGGNSQFYQYLHTLKDLRLTEMQEAHPLFDADYWNYDTEQAISDRMSSYVEEGGVADAPYKNSWHAYVLREAIIQAHKEGKKQIGWATGESSAHLQRSDRFYKEIVIKPTIDDEGRACFSCLRKRIEQNSGRTIMDEIVVIPEGLKKEFGEDRADAILEHFRAPATDVVLNLENVEVRSKRMREFYDGDIVKAGKRLAKLLGVKPPRKVKLNVIRADDIGREQGKWEDNVGDLESWVMDIPEELPAMPRYMPADKAKGDGGNTRSEPDTSYRGYHTAPERQEGASLDNLENIYPEDIYSDRGADYYGSSVYREDDLEAIKIIQEARGNPDKEITIYRAVPADVKKINAGDWVTITKGYAETHAEIVATDGWMGLAGDMQDTRILKMKVRAGDLHSEGNSIQEWGWNPKSLRYMPHRKMEMTQQDAFTVMQDGVRVMSQHGHIPPLGKEITEDIARQLNMPPNLVGKVAFPMQADRLRVGWHTTRSGNTFEMRGGVDHPDLDIHQGQVGWAVMNRSQKGALLNAIEATDGIGLVYLMQEDAVASNRTFARIAVDELMHDWKTVRGAKSIIREQLKIGEQAIKDWAVQTAEKARKQGNPDAKPNAKLMKLKFNSVAELGAILPTLSFAQRKAILPQILSDAYKRKINKLGGDAVSWLDIVRQISDYSPRDGWRAGDVAKVIQFDKENPLIDLNEIGISPDPTYDVSFRGTSVPETIIGQVSAFDIFKDGLDYLAYDKGNLKENPKWESSEERTIKEGRKVGSTALSSLMFRGLSHPKLHIPMKENTFVPPKEELDFKKPKMPRWEVEALDKRAEDNKRERSKYL